MSRQAGDTGHLLTHVPLGPARAPRGSDGGLLAEECPNTQGLIRLPPAAECCKPNTARKLWEALITPPPHRGTFFSSTCVPNNQGFPSGPVQPRLI